MKISVLFSVLSPAGKTAPESDLINGDNTAQVFFFLPPTARFIGVFRFDFNFGANLSAFLRRMK